eukprot:457221-Rhodomonas_salina.2
MRAARRWRTWGREEEWRPREGGPRGREEARRGTGGGSLRGKKDRVSESVERKGGKEEGLRTSEGPGEGRSRA